MRKVPVKFLKPGMKVGRPVYDSMGFLLLNSGVSLKQEYINKLRDLQIASLYIQDERIPDIEIEDVILDETRQEAACLIKNILDDMGKESKKPLNSLLVAKKKLNNVLDDIISQLLNNPNLIINLSDIRLADNYTFSHSVNVAVLAITTAISLGLPRSNLQKLGMGAILHDLGKIKIPLKILNKNGRLLPEEFEEIKKHPRYGYELVKLQKLIDSSSATVIIQHHERVNGMGYPNKLKDGQISYFAKICAVADVYDALVADRPYRAALPPHKALEIIENGGEEFDLGILQNFYQHIAAYPIGTIVGLSNGLIGIVTNNTVGFPMRPVVRIFWTNEFEGVKPFELDLKEKIDVIVNRVYEEEELSQNTIKNVAASVLDLKKTGRNYGR